MSVDLSKGMNLADGKVLYDDLRRRIPEIDDTAGTGATTKVVSADKHATDHNSLLSAINVLKPAATASDVGKALVVKTVADGKPTSFEYGESGGGTVTDVQVNGQSVLTDGVANVPAASTNEFGAVKLGVGFTKNSSNQLILTNPITGDIKNGTNYTKAIVPSVQHVATFYGLAKASGDTTQASSLNAVGIYTDAAKSAIQTMLGVEPGVVFVEEVTGATPTITGIANTRYICGEVSTIDITPPSIGTIDIRFTSGATAAVLTVPSTVKFPDWFDASSLDASTTYEIIITDGIYAGVMVWAE